jgi:hypothetical protein
MRGCQELRLDLPAYAGGRLGAGPAAEVADHLDACPTCRAELAWIEQVVAALGTLAAPPAALERDVFALVELDTVAARLEAAPLGAAPPLDLERRVLQRVGGRGRRVAVLGAPVAAAAAVVLALFGASWRARVEDLERRVATMRSSFGSVGEPLTTVEFASLVSPAPATRAELMTYEDANFRLVLKARDLPPTPPGYHYEVWLLGPKGRVLCGTFRVSSDDDIVLSFPIGVDPSAYSSIDVVLERDDDDPDIQGEPVLQAVLTPPPALLATPAP